MRPAPSAIAWSRNALNLISALHITSGLGVRPARYSARKLAKTRSRYSAAKFTASISIPIFSATETASTRSSRVEQYRSSSSSSQFFMKRPTTSCPARLSNSAATAESTPPERPTTIFIGTILRGLAKTKAGPKPRSRTSGNAELRLLRRVGLRRVGFRRVGFRRGGLGRVGFRRIGGLRRFGLLLLVVFLLRGLLLGLLLVLHGRVGLRGGLGLCGGRGRRRGRGFRASGGGGLGGIGRLRGSGGRGLGEHRRGEHHGDQGRQL